MKNLFIYLSFLTLPFSLFAQQNYTVSTFAGNDTIGKDTAGYRNGLDSIALFNGPSGIATDTMGNVYVADTHNNVIRKIRKDTVTLLAGNGTAGYSGDGGQATAAEFFMPLGICTDSNGNIYVSDTYNNVIREISPATGIVKTFAGNDTAGYRDGAASQAEFHFPVGIAADKQGNIYVADNGNNVIRKIHNDTVTTLAGKGTFGTHNGAADTAGFDGLYGIALDKSGNVYVTEYLNNDVREISNGMVTTLAAGYDTLHQPGYRDGKNDTALFNNPTGIVVNDSGNLFVADEYNNNIREISKGMVSTFAGNGILGYKNGTVNGPVDTANFFNPLGIALDEKGNFYVADNGNNVIRKISILAPLGIVPIYPEKLSMFVYPNPCSDKLVVASAPQGIAKMFDVMGREIWNNEHFKAPCIISTRDIEPGVYFLRIQNESGIATQKIVIAR